MTRIEVVCGFLGSGKTTLIQHILKQDWLQGCRRILILQCEEGKAVWDDSAVKSHSVFLARISSLSEIRPELFSKIRSQLNPDLILVEYNGTWPIEPFLGVRMPKDFRMDQILFCADVSTFDLYWKNAGSLMFSQLSNADAVCVSRCAGAAQTMKATVQSVNRSAAVCMGERAVDRYLTGIFNPKARKEANKWQKIGEAEVSILMAGIFLFFLFLPKDSDLFAAVQSIRMIFLGILIQALPFLLIGSFVSALLQVYVPDEALVRIFTKHRWLGFPLAAALGLVFPVCDCGIVPIASRLVQKGVPLPQATVFLLAAPAVNPVTVLSTLYAFPGQPGYAVCRMILGAFIALAAGFLLSLSKIKSEKVLLTQAAVSCSCACGAGGGTPRHKGRLGRAESVFLAAGQEFLGMGRYVICGSLLCSVVQQAVPPSVFTGSWSAAVSVLLMLLAAFFLSVCSTSNAFIGRSFLNLFPSAAVLGFLVMGPMLDLSNLLMLSGSFQKKFVIRLAAGLLAIGLFVFLLLSMFPEEVPL